MNGPKPVVDTSRWPVPDGYHLVWRLHSLGWQAGGDGKRCRFTVGPGQKTCQEPAVATFARGQQRWGYCASHLYGRWLRDGRFYYPAVRPLDDPGDLPGEPVGEVAS